MFVVECDRTELLRLLAFEEKTTLPELSEQQSIPRASDGNVVLAWRSQPLSADTLPNLIATSDVELSEFLAWAATYLPVFRPITALVRVLGVDELEEAASLEEELSLGRLTGAALGLIATEAYIYASGRKSLTELSTNAYSATLSYALARASALGHSRKLIEQLPDRWSEARRLTGQAALPVSLGVVQAPWQSVLTLRNEELTSPRQATASLTKTMMKACYECFETDSISDSTWRQLTRNWKVAQRALQAMASPREERVVALRKTLEDSLGRADRSGTNSFILGYLASRIAPGTLDHIELLFDASPQAYLWYGMFAGLKSGGSIQSLGQGLGLRIVRELVRRDTLLDRPIGDVSLHELAVLSESHRDDIGLRTTYPGYIEVELVPGVNSVLRTKSKNSERTSERDSEVAQRDLLVNDLQDSVLRLEREIAATQREFERVAQIVGLRDTRHYRRSKSRHR